VNTVTETVLSVSYVRFCSVEFVSFLVLLVIVSQSAVA
jgi:hypothetical protein